MAAGFLLPGGRLPAPSPAVGSSWGSGGRGGVCVWFWGGRDELPGTPHRAPMCWGGERRGSPPRPPRGARAPARPQPFPPQRHCGGRGFLPYMVMAALGAAGRRRSDWWGRGRGAASARPLTPARPRPRRAPRPAPLRSPARRSSAPCPRGAHGGGGEAPSGRPRWRGVRRPRGLRPPFLHPPVLPAEPGAEQQPGLVQLSRACWQWKCFV